MDEERNKKRQNVLKQGKTLKLEENTRTVTMSKRCYMSGCKNNRICKDNGILIPMFPFPTDCNLAKFWLGICNHQPYECPYHGQTICTDHFRPENVQIGNLSDTTGTVLKPNVIPTAKIPNICYSMILEYLKQRKAGGPLDPTKIGVDFTCSKQGCKYNPQTTRVVKLCVAKKQGTSKDPHNQSSNAPSKGVRITLKRKNSDGTEEIQTGPKIFLTAKPKPVETPSEKTSQSSCINPNRPCKIVQRKIVLIPSEIQNRLSQVIKHMTQIIQDFMAFQIHITHLEQAVVCANEKISNFLREAKGDVDPQYYKKFQALNNFLLLLYEIHGLRSSDVLSFCTKIWRRAIDCHQELKCGGKLKVFITAANGCLVTAVKVIDAIATLKSLWKNLELKMEYGVTLDDEWKALDKLINQHVEDATEKLEAVDIEVHMTRQKVLDIKRPSIRILEVAQMDVDGEMVYITEQPDKKKDFEKQESKSLSLVSNIGERKKSSMIELGEIIEDNPVVETPVSPPIQQKSSESIPTSTQIQQDMTPMPIPQPLTLTNNYQTTPSLAYPTMSTLPMQAQLIPTIQLDAFGNQSVVYQLAYQQVTPTIPQQGVTTSLNTPLAGIVIPGYNQNTPNHQASPTLLTNTSQEMNTGQSQIPFHYGTVIENPRTIAATPPQEQVVVVKPDSISDEPIQIKQEQEDVEEIKTVPEQDTTYIKEEPEWNEEISNQ